MSGNDDAHSRAIREVLKKHEIENEALVDQIWQVLYDLEDDSNEVTGDERKELKRLQGGVKNFARRLYDLERTTFTYDNGDFISDVISSLKELDRRITNRLQDDSREARNPGTQNERLRIFDALNSAKVGRNRHHYATIIAKILNAITPAHKQKEDVATLRDAIVQQLRDRRKPGKK